MKGHEGNFWTDRDCLELYEAWISGWTIKSLAEFHGVSVTSISTHKKKGMKLKHNLIEKEKIKISLIEAQTNLHLEKIASHPKARLERLNHTMLFLKSLNHV